MTILQYFKSYAKRNTYKSYRLEVHYCQFASIIIKKNIYIFCFFPFRYEAQNKVFSFYKALIYGWLNFRMNKIESKMIFKFFILRLFNAERHCYHLKSDSPSLQSDSPSSQVGRSIYERSRQFFNSI